MKEKNNNFVRYALFLHFFYDNYPIKKKISLYKTH